jgi:hypothetical protein
LWWTFLTRSFAGFFHFLIDEELERASGLSLDFFLQLRTFHSQQLFFFFQSCEWRDVWVDPSHGCWLSHYKIFSWSHGCLKCWSINHWFRSALLNGIFLYRDISPCQKKELNPIAVSTGPVRWSS